jgi:hypothetical protein
VSTAFELLHLRDDLAYRRPSMGGYGYASPRAMKAAAPVQAPDETPPPAQSEGRLVRATPLTPSSTSGASGKSDKKGRG